MCAEDGSQKKSRAKDTEGDPVLVVQGGLDNGATIRLSSITHTLGRHADNDVVVDEAAVSREHAIIVKGETGYRLRDLGSTNGTFVNRRKIGTDERVLTHGDVIRLGGSTTSFKFNHAGSRTITLPAVESASDAVYVDTKARQVYVLGERLDPPTSRKEFDLLMLLDSRRGEAVSRDDISVEVWPERVQGDVGNHEIEQCVRRIRVRIEQNPSKPDYLVTVRGYGYKLN